MYTVKFFHQLWFLEQHRTFNQILKVRVDAGSNASFLRCPLTTGDINVVANLTTTSPHQQLK